MSGLQNIINFAHAHATLLEQLLKMNQTAAIKVLLVDDEPDIIEFLGYNLRKEGFDVITAQSGSEALTVATREHPDVIVLDVMMPAPDGIEVCRQLRDNKQFANTIILFLTARDEDYTQIAGLDNGADDFISKPVKPRVFISRLRALLRRAHTPAESAPHATSALTVDRERYVVRYENNEHNLPRKEFELLALLADKPGRVFTRDEILQAVWGDEIVVGNRTIDVHVRKLREKMGDDFISTIKGIGYKLNV